MIGAYYRNIHTRDYLYKYIVGALEKQENGKCIVHSVGDCATGISASERNSINELLSKNLHDYPINQNEIQYAGGKLLFGTKKPHVWIPPDKSIILEIKAAELFQSDDYSTSHTFRFARINAVRRDKTWDEACPLEEFDLMCRNTKSDVVRKLNQRSVNLDDITSPTRGKKRKKTAISRVEDDGDAEELVSLTLKFP